MTALPPPGSDRRGWHTDPFGRHRQRWWDGTRWTERVRSGDVAGIDPPGVDPMPAAPGATDAVDPLQANLGVELRSLNVARALVVGLLLLFVIVALVVVDLLS
jgi:hypothetical protein